MYQGNSCRCLSMPGLQMSHRFLGKVKFHTLSGQLRYISDTCLHHQRWRLTGRHFQHQSGEWYLVKKKKSYENYYQWIWYLMLLSTIFHLYCGCQFLVEETRVHGVNHRPVVSHWQTWLHNVVPSTLLHKGDSNTQL